jgi:hypothetical protein
VSKLPEGIGFTAEDFGDHPTHGEWCARKANAKLPALFEAWVKREGVKVWGNVEFGWWNEGETDNEQWRATHTGYVVLIEGIEK